MSVVKSARLVSANIAASYAQLCLASSIEKRDMNGRSQDAIEKFTWRVSLPEKTLASFAKKHVDQVLITQIKNACRGSESPPLEFIGIFAPPGTGHSRLDISKFFSRVDEE